VENNIFLRHFLNPVLISVLSSRSRSQLSTENYVLANEVETFAGIIGGVIGALSVHKSLPTNGIYVDVG
jgi:hypothetical protein